MRICVSIINIEINLLTCVSKISCSIYILAIITMINICCQNRLCYGCIIYNTSMK
ncbi:hypothetical protein GLOIN_2v1718677 [Rhizophagus irregularis DAOM 181602=DAOM 197198]|uniref:Uncharacterized protein n=1 Tax=Rhizophagus irregularis (strain DAOM 181602 / DAOM 197198 / MUCL 43194) TaxID=747089 RepID=A0A2P4P3C3_RHIID|nr:hypothetical protein GLOIN_2v1718677 [Rhizophagus irregularis DAOM 181602=DAOM 197198]POG59868.1 hypothetical protein GLOIN_2v1718677 [Rhizophagus irregularis DAOM 181602=DAOM 197198]|eukprot:XP_025166734.1 hypothetical protein GLOIN_2v1718677 [Rhizophagus irregularis DAOM 181602=DAOM 197198]